MRTYAKLIALTLVCGCGDSDDEESDTTAADTTMTAGTSGATDDPTTPSTTATSPSTTASTTDPSTTMPGTGDDTTGDMSDTAEDTGGSESTGGSDTGTGGMAFHPEFLWIADFVREKCVDCHNMGQNGNLLLPSPDMTVDEVRLAIDGGVATTGRLFIEPNNPPESQMYIMITNDAGEQFPQETIDRFAGWINLGAPYYE